ncbi:aldehyde dehydrogenase family protein [Cupriavidus oxalaticus]|uniref:aldehyde dehydrogenase family protein n=1 Tax=Cupriavidus oxalaticus TaxID=96344 RepID=UPI00316B1A5C
MYHADKFYLNGAWTAPAAGGTLAEIVNPATEAVIGTMAMGTAEDVDRAVEAACSAFPAWSETSREARLDLLERILAGCTARKEDLAMAISAEIGAPISLARTAHVGLALAQLDMVVKTLREFAFETPHGSNTVRREPIGVAGLITAWNWPLVMVCNKVATALAAGCTVVLKPSEIAPLDARIFAEIVHEAGAPAGVFNLVQGAGQVVGAALCAHRGVAMVSFTGSTRAGIEVARNAAPTVKRVAQELGGKSPLIVLDDADLGTAVKTGVMQLMMNSGQTCVAPTRMLVPRDRYDDAVGIAAAVANGLKVGDPSDAGTQVGTISNRQQYEKVQRMIGIGIEEGARVAAGGPGRPDGLAHGLYARPTIFADVRNDMTIAREEIFGPVLAVIPYDDEDDAIAIANDTDYGLAAYVASGDTARARRVAARIRAGSVRINGASTDLSLPFGGYKASGNGRENGAHGLAEFLECKAVIG